MNRETLSKEELEILRKYDTPTVCNVIELFNIRPRNVGFMNDRIKASFPEMPPMVGYAATATFRSAAPARGDVYTSLVEQVSLFSEVPSPPVVVFQDLDDPPVAATFGEVMCTAYKAFGATGLITSGAGRDLPQVRALGFPVFTSGAICSHGYAHIPSIQVPVSVGGVTVHPGDLLHGDSNGVTTIPKEIAREVGEGCEQFMAAEAVILNYLKSGKVTKEGMAEVDAECHEMIAKIAQQVARK